MPAILFRPHCIESCILYCQTSSIRHIKSQHLIFVSHLVLELPLSNPLKSGVKLRMKMQLEQHRQALLQLHLSDQQVYYLLIRVWLISEVWQYMTIFGVIWTNSIHIYKNWSWTEWLLGMKALVDASVIIEFKLNINIHNEDIEWGWFGVYWHLVIYIAIKLVSVENYKPCIITCCIICVFLLLKY